MKILSDGRAVDVLLESINLTDDAAMGTVEVEMVLVFDREADMAFASRAKPIWIVHPERERSDGERMLAERFSSEPRDAEEKVAVALMGLDGMGKVRIMSMVQERKTVFGQHLVSLRATVRGYFIAGGKE